MLNATLLRSAPPEIGTTSHYPCGAMRRAHRQLRMAWNSRLAGSRTRRAERGGGEFLSGRHPPRGGANTRASIGPIGVGRERLGELRARVSAVCEDYSGTPPSLSIICWVVTCLCFFLMQVALGGSGSSGTNLVGFCEKLNMLPIEVEVSSVV